MDKEGTENIYNDDEYLYKSPFNAAYWTMARREFKTVKKLCLISILIALRVVCQATSLPIVKGYLEIQFDFIPAMISGLIFGPYVSIVSGFIADNVGFLINPSSGYNPCYTISAIASGFIYSLFLYKQKLSIMRIMVSKLIVNILVNAILGTYWIYLFYNTNGKGFMILLGTRLIKNLIALPIEVVVIVILMGLLLPILKTTGLISENQPNKIKLL